MYKDTNMLPEDILKLTDRTAQLAELRADNYSVIRRAHRDSCLRSPPKCSLELFENLLNALPEAEQAEVVRQNDYDLVKTPILNKSVAERMLNILPEEEQVKAVRRHGYFNLAHSLSLPQKSFEKLLNMIPKEEIVRDMREDRYDLLIRAVEYRFLEISEMLLNMLSEQELLDAVRNDQYSLLKHAAALPSGILFERLLNVLPEDERLTAIRNDHYSALAAAGSSQTIRKISSVLGTEEINTIAYEACREDVLRANGIDSTEKQYDVELIAQLLGEQDSSINAMEALASAIEITKASQALLPLAKSSSKADKLKGLSEDAMGDVMSFLTGLDGATSAKILQSLQKSPQTKSVEKIIRSLTVGGLQLTLGLLNVMNDINDRMFEHSPFERKTRFNQLFDKTFKRTLTRERKLTAAAKTLAPRPPEDGSERSR